MLLSSRGYKCSHSLFGKYGITACIDTVRTVIEKAGENNFAMAALNELFDFWEDRFKRNYWMKGWANTKNLAILIIISPKEPFQKELESLYFHDFCFPGDEIEQNKYFS